MLKKLQLYVWVSGSPVWVLKGVLGFPSRT